jgi:hypothetical protein
MKNKKYKIVIELESKDINEESLNEEITNLRREFEENEKFELDILNLYWVEVK